MFRNRRALFALGAMVAAVGVYACLAFWRAARTLQIATDQSAREAVVEFTDSSFDLNPPRGFEVVAAPSGFRDAAVVEDRVFVAGGGGLFEYDADGRLQRQFRAGLEFPAAPVSGIARSRDGRLWIATMGEGALVFDGARFRHLRPAAARHRKMTAVLALETGRILFGTDTGGVAVFDGKTMAPLVASLADSQVTALAGDEASLWIGTQDGGVLNWHAGQLDRIGEAEGLPDAHVFSIVVDGDSAYAATALGIAEIRDRKVQRVFGRGFTVETVLKQGNQLIAGTLDEGLIRIPLEARSQPESMPARECDGCSVHKLIAAGDAVLAVTSTGVFRIESKRTDWKPLVADGQSGLADRNIAAVAPDPSGRVWIGYFDRGLDIYSPGTARAEHFEDDVLFCVNRIVHDRARDRTAVATANGLVLFGGGSAQRHTLTRADGLIASHVTDVLMLPDGTMVAGTPAGVSFIEAGRISSLYAFHGLLNNHVYALGQVANRTLVGTLGGLSVVEAGLARAGYSTSNSGFRHNWITAVLATPKDVFVGTYGGGVMHGDGDGSWQPFADLPAQFEVNPNAMAASDRAVYAGTLDRGLAVFNRASSRWHWVTRGLPSLNVTAVAAQSGSVYIGTDNGLVRAPEEALVQ